MSNSEETPKKPKKPHIRPAETAYGFNSGNLGRSVSDACMTTYTHIDESYTKKTSKRKPK